MAKKISNFLNWLCSCRNLTQDVEYVFMKGKEYPDTFAELEKMFKSDSDCYDYLKKLRWPKGFV